jgi:hypothetical protein
MLEKGVVMFAISSYGKLRRKKNYSIQFYVLFIGVHFLNTVFIGKLTSFFPNTLFRILTRLLLPGELSSVLFEHLWYSCLRWYTQNSHLLLFTKTVQRPPVFFLENYNTHKALYSVTSIYRSRIIRFPGSIVQFPQPLK